MFFTNFVVVFGINKTKSAAIMLLFSFVLTAVSIPLAVAGGDSWETLESMPTARFSFGVAVVNGKIHAIGGSNGTHRLDVNEMYDPATDTWTTKKPMPTARTGPATAVYQNKIYVIGGIVADSSPSYSGYTGVTEVYDPATDTWATMEPMPTARACLDANVVDDKIYLIGGTNYVDVFPFQQSNNKNQVYDPSNNSWSTKTPIPIGNQGYASAVVDNKICIIGVGHNQIYTPETDTWASGTPSPTFVVHAAAGATTGEFAPKRIYVFGGMYDYSNVAANLTQIYDMETDTWTTGTPMLTARWSLGVAVINDEFYVIGGKTETGDNFSAVNEKYTPAGYVPEFSSWMVLPLFLTVTLIVVISKRKLSKTPN